MENVETEVALLRQAVVNTAKIVEDHEGRMRRLERVIYAAMGIVGIGGFILHAWEVVKK